MDHVRGDTLEQPEFGRRLRSLRSAHGLSQAQLAGPGMSTAYLSRLESGARPPTARAVAYLCAQLSVPASAFRKTDPHPLAHVLACTASGPESEESAQRLLDVYTREQDADPALRWHALWVLARWQEIHAETETHLMSLRTLVELSDQIGLPDLRARARVAMARAQRSGGRDLRSAGLAAREALEIAESHGHSHTEIVQALLVLISIEAETGSLADADTHTDRLNALITDVSSSLRVEALWTMASLRVRQGRHSEGAPLLERAMDELGSTDNLRLWTRLRLAAASLYLQMTPRDLSQAARHLEEARPAVDLIGVPLHSHEHCALRARLAFYQGDVDLARTLCASVALAPGHLAFRDQIRHELLLCQLRIIDGDRSAIADIEALTHRSGEAANTELTAEIWRSLAEVLARADA
ncbi:helix-turn-helix domain-containing protein [Kitasatospora sp. NBC_01287]|uniref:helix-turn-helix domain-containing protein n=1 Tax=Kitasatospora sp. NBC_01287 TaxID=2903573 RepID=UPI00224E8A2B|nr:helix-turn-helix domain-containing protein [Kitasatospora sp. NBC_01287]MCX4745118.1 helix-turn-helix domain-containing protein [Kitasatospora sp. NBC_01287]